MSRIALLLCCLMFLAAIGVSAFDLGKGSKIITGKDMNSTETFAAEELQQMIKKISGTELKIVKGGRLESHDIIIGTPETCAAVKTVAGKLKLGSRNAEKIAVCVIGNKLYLAGNSPRAALYAVYTFLDKELKVKWLWPGKTGEFYPKQKTIKIQDNLAISEEPALKFRGYHLCGVHRDAATELWMARNRLNYLFSGGYFSEKPKVMARREKLGHHIVFAGHNTRLGRDVFKIHPEYFALINGKRNRKQLCWSSDGAAKTIADKCVKAWKKYPGLKYILFAASDNTDRCTCDKCKNMRPSNLWHQFLTKIITEADKRYPKGKYATLAYSLYQNPPEKPAPLDSVTICLYNRCYRHDMNDPKCRCNAHARELIEKWKKHKIPLIIYGYEFDMFNSGNYVNLSPVLQDQAKWMRNNKLAGYLSETVPPVHNKRISAKKLRKWLSYRFSLYANARLLWDPDESLDAILGDWCAYAYGPAAKSLEKYYKLMGEAWRKGKDISYYGTPPASVAGEYLSPALFKQTDSLFKNAEAEVAKITDPDKKQAVMAQIELEKNLLEDWKKIYANSKLLRTRSQIQVPVFAATEVGKNWLASELWKKAAALPEFFDSKKKPVKKAPTKVCVFATPENIYIKAVCHDPDIEKLNIRGKETDSNVWSGECLELFMTGLGINPGHYAHLSVNPEGVKYDAIGLGGMRFDKNWNSGWTIKTERGKTAWTAYMKIPAKAVAGKIEPGSEINIGIVRTNGHRKDYSSSGFPVIAYHSLSSLGILVFVSPDKLNGKRIVLFTGGYKPKILGVELTKLGWCVSSADNPANLVKELERKPDLIAVKSGRKGLKENFFRKYLKPYVNDGGMLVLAYSGTPHLDKFFNDPELEITKGTWRGKGAPRRSTFIAEGNWKNTPNKGLERKLQRSLAPVYGYITYGKGWKKLAGAETNTGKAVTYLMTAKYGKGEIVMTSGGLGYCGGGSMFGNLHPQNSAFLIDNLYHAFMDNN